jgi:Sulfite exporter TauE/SafE
MSLFLLAVFALVGLGSGFVDAIAGCGGLLTLPALALAGLDSVAAVATNKLASTFGSGSATFAFWRAGKIEAAMAPPALARRSVGWSFLTRRGVERGVAVRASGRCSILRVCANLGRGAPPSTLFAGALRLDARAGDRLL